MNPCPPPAVTLPALNEHARAAVALPEGTTFYNDCQYILINWDSNGDEPLMPPSILFSKPDLLPYYPKYRAIDLLCGSRARQAVDGTLRVQGAIVTPEAYLGLWRSALAEAMSPAQLADRCGLRILVTIGAALETARMAKSGWSTSPFETFATFERAYGDRFTFAPMGDGSTGFEITLDLLEPDAARDAFYADSLISRNAAAAGYLRTSLAPSDRSARLPPPMHSQTSLVEGASQ